MTSKSKKPTTAEGDMAFGGADFLPSASPVATKALQLAAIKAVRDASRNSKSLREFSTQIKSGFEAANGYGWHVLVGMDFAVDLRYRKAACVLLVSKKSKLKVLIYRTTPATASLPAVEADEPVSEDSLAKKRTKVTWHSSDMDDASKAVVVQYTQSLVAKLAVQKKKEDVHTELVQLLKHKLTAKYGHTWHAIVSNTREMSCLPYCDPGTFADFSLDAFRVVVYRHNGVDVDTKMDMTQFGYRAMLTLAAICFVIYGYFAMATTELHTKCAVEGESPPLPDGCTEADVVLATAHNKWKSTTFVGLIVFTILASSVRMYRRALRQKLKHG